jgi:sugar/nucleoside kinase (ribokinase family)
MSKTIDVVGICNALVDILFQVDDSALEKFSLRKGVMHLVDGAAQKKFLENLKGLDGAEELGGSSMNVIRTLAALGSRCSFAGMIGPDEFGARIAKRMQQLRIDQHLGKTDEATGSCVILVTPDGERTMHTCLGASRLYTEAQVPHDAISKAKVLHFCGYQWDTEGQKQGIRAAIKTAKSNGTTISFDVADPFVVERYKNEFVEIIKNDADIVFCNKSEAETLYGSPDQAATAIAQSGAIAVIKVGAEGAIVQHGSAKHKIQPVKTHVIDTTAAGDMFAAGFLYGYLNNKDLPTAGHLGAMLASDVISRLGATVSEGALAKAASV